MPEKLSSDIGENQHLVSEQFVYKAKERGGHEIETNIRRSLWCEDVLV